MNFGFEALYCLSQIAVDELSRARVVGNMHEVLGFYCLSTCWESSRPFQDLGGSQFPHFAFSDSIGSMAGKYIPVF